MGFNYNAHNFTRLPAVAHIHINASTCNIESCMCTDMDDKYMQAFAWIQFVTYTRKHAETQKRTNDHKCTNAWMSAYKLTNTEMHEYILILHIVHTFYDSSHMLSITEKCRHRPTNTNTHICLSADQSRSEPFFLSTSRPVPPLLFLLRHPNISSLVFCPLPTSSVFSISAELSRPFLSPSICRRDPEISARPLRGPPSRSGLTLFAPLVSSVCPSPVRLCSPLHQVRGTEGWDLQRRRLLRSRGFDQTGSHERSLADC